MASKKVYKSTNLQVMTAEKIFQPIKKAHLQDIKDNIELAEGTAVDVESTPIKGKEQQGATADNDYYKVVKIHGNLKPLPSVAVYIKGSDLTPTMVSKMVNKSTKLQVWKDDIFQPIRPAGLGDNIELAQGTVVDVESTPIKGKEQTGATADNDYYKVVKIHRNLQSLPSVAVYIKGIDLTPMKS